MCGLVGGFSTTPLSDNELNTFSSLLYCSALRGEDSTGVMLVTEDGTFDYFKAAVTPSEFICNQLPTLLNKHKKKITGIFGHTRLATVGKIKHSNSHPFLVRKEIMMMHNGNVMSAPEVEVKAFEVDSMALAHSLQKHEDPKDVFSKFIGAACVLWFDMRTKTFNVFRNHERPLSYHQAYATTWIASEKRMLEWIMARERNGGDTKEVEAGKVYKYDAKDFRKAPEVVSVPFVSTTYGGNGTTGKYGSYFSRGGNDHYYTQRGSNNNNVDIDNKVIRLPPRRVEPDPVDKETLRVAAQESQLLILKEYGPFEVGDSILACPIKMNEFQGKARSSYRLELNPLCLNWTEDFRNKFGEVRLCFHNHDEAKANELFAAPIVEGQITNILYNRSKEKMEERLTVYLGSAKPHGSYNG